jgi:hypothetical protein
MVVGKRGKWLSGWLDRWGKVSIRNREIGLVGENGRIFFVTGLPVTGYRFVSSRLQVPGHGTLRVLNAVEGIEGAVRETERSRGLRVWFNGCYRPSGLSDLWEITFAVQTSPGPPADCWLITAYWFFNFQASPFNFIGLPINFKVPLFKSEVPPFGLMASYYILMP